jgi:hypothetical protein
MNEVGQIHCKQAGHNFVVAESEGRQGVSYVRSLYCTKCGEQKFLEYPDKNPAVEESHG